MEYTKLMAVLNECHDKHTPMLIYWDDGCVFKSSTDNTGSFESDNSFEAELEDENYQEFFACWVGGGNY